MNRTDKMIKRCRALALAGVLGLASLGNAVPALAAGPGDDASRVTEISAGGHGDPGNKTSSNSTPNTNNSNNNNNTKNNNNTNNSNTSSSDTTANANAWKKVNGTYQMPD